MRIISLTSGEIDKGQATIDTLGLNRSDLKGLREASAARFASTYKISVLVKRDIQSLFGLNEDLASSVPFVAMHRGMLERWILDLKDRGESIEHLGYLQDLYPIDSEVEEALRAMAPPPAAETG